MRSSTGAGGPIKRMDGHGGGFYGPLAGDLRALNTSGGVIGAPEAMWAGIGADSIQPPEPVDAVGDRE